MMRCRDLTVQITNRCNLNCDYCFANSNSTKQELSVNEIKKAIDAINPRRIAFSGGEPLLRQDDVVSLLPYVYENIGFPTKGIRIETNGTHKIMFDEYQKNGDVSGFQFNLSLDGFKDINDLQRGDGTFDKVVGNAKELVERGYWTTIKSTFDDDILINHIDYLYDFAKFCREEIGLLRIRFGNVKNSGRGSRIIDESYIETIEKIKANINSVNDMVEKDTGYISPDGKPFLTIAVCDSCSYNRNDLVLRTDGIINLECVFLNIPLCHYTKYTPNLHEMGQLIMKTLDMGGKNNMRYDMSYRKTVFG